MSSVQPGLAATPVTLASLQAQHFISGYARAPAQTVSAVLCTNLDTGRECEGIDVATVSHVPGPAGSALGSALPCCTPMGCECKRGRCVTCASLYEPKPVKQPL